MTFRLFRIQFLIVVVSISLFAVTDASAIPFTKGDVFAGVGNGKVAEFTPTGALVQILDSTTGSSEMTGMAFDSSGNLYATGFETSTLSKFNNNGTLAAATFIPAGTTNHNESVVFDSAGNFFVGGADQQTIKKFNSAGTLLHTWTVTTGPRGTDWIDLAADQHTIHYTSEGGNIYSFDTATGTQLPDFSTSLGGVSYAHRILSDGGELVAHTSNVVRTNSSGTVIQTYTIPGGTALFALNLDPDGTTFWTGNIDGVGTVFHVRISDGAILGQFNTVAVAGGVDLAGLAVFGEITQGAPPPTGTPEPATLFLLGFGMVGLVGLVHRRRQN